MISPCVRIEITYADGSKQLATGEGNPFRGAPNLGTCGGPAESPQLPAALKEI